MTSPHSPRPSILQHWDANQNRGTPSTCFVGDFQLPQVGTQEKQAVAITTPHISALAGVPQCDCRHQYSPNIVHSNEACQCSVMSKTTSSCTPVRETRNKGWRRLLSQIKPRMTPKLVSVIDLQASQQLPRYSSPHPPEQPRLPRKKAVCVGINYNFNAELETLRGCVNDARGFRDFLKSKWGFEWDEIQVLADAIKDDYNERSPTKDNILSAMKWLVEDAGAHDSLVFFYSGHGTQERDTDGDEADGWDEAIVPVDFNPQTGVGLINDDTMNELLVQPLPADCQLTALFDSCNSGSALDLVYRHSSKGGLKKSDVKEKHHEKKSSAGKVVCFSGCKDNKESKEVVRGEQRYGAMSDAFRTYLRDRDSSPTYLELLKNLRVILRENNHPQKQKPQLSSSYKFNAKRTHFTL